MRVIVVCGNKNNGKTLFANMLHKHLGILGCKPLHLNFADGVKRTAHEMFGIPLTILYANSQVKESTFYFGKSVREILQWVGTQAREYAGKTVWVDRLWTRCKKADATDVVVGDGRLPEEEIEYFSEIVKKDGHDFFSIVIRRPGFEGEDEHESEKLIREYHDSYFWQAVCNDKKVEDLDCHAEIVAKELVKF